MKRFALLVTCVLLVATACGPRYETTSDDTQVAAVDDLTGQPVDGVQPQANGSTQTGTAPTTGGTSVTSPTSPTTGSNAAPATVPIADQTYRGITKSEITIGVMASKTVNSAYAALGAEGAAFPDPEKQIAPIVAHINRNGGIAGRKLKIAWHFRDDLSTDTDDSKMQQACTDFVQDKKVFVVTSIYQGHGMAPCLAQSDIALIESGAGPPWLGVPTYDSLKGYYLTPNQISVDRYSAALVDGIASRGFFSTGTRVGLVYMGFPHASAAVSRSLKPALKRHGVTLVDEQELRPIERASDFAGTQAEVSNAVLRFKQKNINRVIFLEDQATTFMTAAEQQDYFPRYGIGSASLFGAAASNPDSMKDSTIVGFSVPLDVLPAYRGTPKPAEKTCRKIYLDSRQAPADELAWGLMELHCEGFFFIKAALGSATSLSTRGLITAIESLGTKYPSLTTYGTRFGSGRYDGPATARPLRFESGCTCLKYAGPPYAIK